MHVKTPMPCEICSQRLEALCVGEGEGEGESGR
jgi:hypothetical protein